MTTIDDFRSSLSSDPSDWMILADWLEEHDDQRGKHVRFVAEYSVDHTEESPVLFLLGRRHEECGCVAVRWLIDADIRASRYPTDLSWLDVLLWLADANVRWDAARESLLDLLGDRLRQIAIMRTNGVSHEEIANQLNLRVATVERCVSRIRTRWLKEFEQHAAHKK